MLNDILQTLNEFAKFYSHKTHKFLQNTAHFVLAQVAVNHNYSTENLQHGKIDKSSNIYFIIHRQ
jgi:hypothetical protein